jgi:signal peptidase I
VRDDVGVPRGIAALAALAAFLVAGCGKGGGGTIAVVTTSQTSASALRAYRVPSGSMEPTIALGEYVFAESLKAAPRVGDIVIFHPPKDAAGEICGPEPHMIKMGGAACAEPETEPSEVKFVKRIVAAPGDTISIVEGHLIRNGKRERDSYIRSCGGAPECNFPTPIKIPGGEWFTLGDNRGESDDSRFWGPVPTGWIIGGAFATYWPIDRIGIL